MMAKINLIMKYVKVIPTIITLDESFASVQDAPSSIDLQILYQNVCSIRGRLDTVRANSSLLIDFDIIVLTETRLNDNIKNSELVLKNFNVIRCSRSESTSAKSDGGGVLIEINEKFKFSVIPLSKNLFEFIEYLLKFLLEVTH